MQRNTIPYLLQAGEKNGSGETETRMKHTGHLASLCRTRQSLQSGLNLALFSCSKSKRPKEPKNEYCNVCCGGRDGGDDYRHTEWGGVTPLHHPCRIGVRMALVRGRGGWGGVGWGGVGGRPIQQGPTQ